MNQTEAPENTSETSPVDDQGAVPREVLEQIRDFVNSADASGLKTFFADRHLTEFTDFLHYLQADERVEFIRLLGSDFDFAALTEVDSIISDQLLSALSLEEIAAGIRDLDSDDAVYLIEDLDEQLQMAVLSRLPVLDRKTLERNLEYPEESAGRRMQGEFIAVPPFWTVGQTIDYMRESDDLPDDFYEIFIVDPSYRYTGSLALDKLLRAKRPERIHEIMDRSDYSVNAIDDQEEVARVFERYNLVSLAVRDDNHRLIGVIMHDDILDVIQEEAQEDMRLLSGVGDEEMSDSVVSTARSRILWLIVNLITAIFASLFIQVFENPIQHKVELAILMGIVASMGGNAATQTMTVAVRAIATREMVGYRARRAFTRELLVGVLNGAALAVICAGVTFVWFHDFELGLVIGIALFINHMVAGTAGILVPLGLEKMKIDPAVASGVFVTTVTDIVGFTVFLLIAAWWFNLW